MFLNYFHQQLRFFQFYVIWQRSVDFSSQYVQSVFVDFRCPIFISQQKRQFFLSLESKNCIHQPKFEKVVMGLDLCTTGRFMNFWLSLILLIIRMPKTVFSISWQEI